jgi:hypothetical protein
MDMSVFALVHHGHIHPKAMLTRHRDAREDAHAAPDEDVAAAQPLAGEYQVGRVRTA